MTLLKKKDLCSGFRVYKYLEGTNIEWIKRTWVAQKPGSYSRMSMVYM